MARIYGYYVLPFLMDETLVARVDLKADRHNGKLLGKATHREDGAPQETVVELAVALSRMADWSGLADISVGRRR